MSILSNARHERFAQELAQGKSASEAFVLAGFSENSSNAARLNANERVRSRVRELQQVAAETAGLTVQWVLEGLKQNYERSLQEVEVKDSEGNGTGEFRYEGAVANRSLELIGKHLGMFVERLETKVVAEICDTPLSPEDRDRAWLESHGATVQ